MATQSIPKPPWTVEKLGEAEYCRLANEYGIFNPSMESPSYRPALDLTAQYREQESTAPAQPGAKTPTAGAKE